MSIMSQVAKLNSVYLFKSMQCHITIISSKIGEQIRENSETIETRKIIAKCQPDDMPKTIDKDTSEHRKI